jgi:hypothetical protein
MKNKRSDETMSNNKEMKLLIEGFNKFLNEATESREFAPTTGEVDFVWGTYTSTAKDEKYFIMDGEDSLGKIQKAGDPFTYNDAGNDRATIVSAPESRKSSIGASVDITDITNKQTGSDKESESDSEPESDSESESVPVYNLPAAINLARLSELYEKYDATVESYKETLSKKTTTLTIGGYTSPASYYKALTRLAGSQARIPDEIRDETPEDIILAQQAVAEYESVCRDAISKGHEALDSFVFDVVNWAKKSKSGQDAAKLAFDTLKKPISEFIKTIAQHPLILKSPEGVTQSKMTMYLWNIEDRQDISYNAARKIAFGPFDKTSSRNISIMASPTVDNSFGANDVMQPF